MLWVIVETVFSAWIVYLSSAVFQFLTARDTGQQNGCLSPSSVGEPVGPLGEGANTHQLSCYITAAFTIIAAWNFD